MNTKRFGLFFIFTALVSGMAVVSRFAPVHERILEIAEWIPWAVLILQFSLLFLASYFESHMEYEEGLENFPAWMKIKSIPVKLSFTLCFTYLVVTASQTWQIKFGPIDFSSSSDQLTTFLIFTFGMFFINYIAAGKFLIPPMRLFMGLFKPLPMSLGASLAALLGLGAGFGVVYAMHSKYSGLALKSYDTLMNQWWMIIGVVLATVVLPVIFGLVLQRRASQ